MEIQFGTETEIGISRANPEALELFRGLDALKN